MVNKIVLIWFVSLVMSSVNQPCRVAGEYGCVEFLFAVSFLKDNAGILGSWVMLLTILAILLAFQCMCLAWNPRVISLFNCILLDTYCFHMPSADVFLDLVFSTVTVTLEMPSMAFVLLS